MTGIGTSIDSEASYRSAIALVVATARSEIRIFDRTLGAMGLDQRATVEVLQQFLAASGDRRLRIVVHDVAPLQTHMPRLIALLRDFAHQIEVRVTPEHLHNLADCWVLADQESGAIRFHADHARGKYVVADPVEIKPWWQRADDLMAECESCTPWAVAGL